ncbi:MAG: cupin domain-containing protein [Deltaproteobacteria bacterium]|nr:MAG: cupin domain-containing protein [Deltaproteobacteria bacterium]
MGFLERLTDVTGSEIIDGEVVPIDRTIDGTPKFINSGVGLRSVLDRTRLSFETAFDAGERTDFFRQGDRLNPTHLVMPPNCLSQGPHFHPGGEFSYVVSGEYFDADMEGNVLRVYPAGTTVFYARGSSHRPLSQEGAEILYIPFDGIVFGKDPEDLLRRMVRLATPEEAIEYALLWMVPDPKRRQALLDTLF